MNNAEIEELKRIFLSRIETLEHILSLGEQHLEDFEAALQERLAPDMLPLGAQIVFACNQPRGFAQWCAGQPVQNLDSDVKSVAVVRDHIASTKALLNGITAQDSKLDETKRTGLGPGRYCETPARLYVSDYLIPNIYFHITTSYAILRMLGVPLGKIDFMRFLLPHVRQEQAA